VAEIAVNAVPAIFLPYPHHRDQHQKHNAQPLVDLGGAVMIDDAVNAEANAAAIAPVLESLLRDEAKRNDMRATLAARRSPDAAEVIAKMVI
jgi:UDP-N-acetylglucosamine--N-acetylmuramyl-(pentapeptide) pyrophosphoryl-undecaprenol N-acetylglucosamine transferase